MDRDRRGHGLHPAGRTLEGRALHNLLTCGAKGAPLEGRKMYRGKIIRSPMSRTDGGAFIAFMPASHGFSARAPAQAGAVNRAHPAHTETRRPRLACGLQTNGATVPGKTMQRLGSTSTNQWQVSETRADLVRAPVPSLPFEFAATPQSLRVDARRTALIVIDMQNDFCHPRGWLAHIGVDVAPARRPIGPLRKLLPIVRASGIPVLWVNWGNRPDRLNLSPSLLHVYKPTGVGVGLGDELAGPGTRVLEKNSWGASIVEELVPAESDIHVDKFRMSGFWDTPLESILRNLGVTTLLFAGVNIDQCVLCTLQDANFLGYDCVMLEDCSATTSPEYCRQATLYNVRQCFGFVADSTRVIEGLRKLQGGS
jgi:nicotinamidase-related amidase